MVVVDRGNFIFARSASSAPGHFIRPFFQDEANASRHAKRSPETLWEKSGNRMDSFCSINQLVHMALGKPGTFGELFPALGMEACGGSAFFYLTGESCTGLCAGFFEIDRRKTFVRERSLMFTRRVIPCLDIQAGRVVKGVRFGHLRDAGDPVECARAYDRAKADELVFLDIAASYEKRKTIVELARKVAESVYIPFTVGGGIQNVEDIRELLKAGCDKVSVNTAAVLNPRLIQQASRRFGSQCIVVAIDARMERAGKWNVFTHGGKKPTRLDAVAWARRAECLGAGEILLTSMDRDGTKLGYDLELTQRISSAVQIPVIASGGVGELRHFYDALTKGKADAVLAASIFHFGEYTVSEVKRYLKRRGVPVRL